MRTATAFPTATTTKRLSAAEVATFQADGFVVGRGILAPADLQPVRDEISAWLGARARQLHAEGKLAELHADADFHTRYGLLMAQCGAIQDGFDVAFLRGAATFEFFRTPALLDAVEDLIGGEISLNPITHYRAKPPVGQTRDDLKGYFAVPWHQDSGVIVEEADASAIITTWIPLVDVSEEMGCLQALPQGHVHGHLPHVSVPGYGTSIRPSAMPRGTPRKLEVRAGDVVFMHRHCPHHSGPNRSRRCRWSLDMRYHRSGDNSGRPWQPEAVLRSATRPLELDHGAWSRAWEHALANGKGHVAHRIAAQ